MVRPVAEDSIGGGADEKLSGPLLDTHANLIFGNEVDACRETKTQKSDPPRECGHGAASSTLRLKGNSSAYTYFACKFFWC